MENNVKDGSGGAPPPAKSNNENPNSTATEPEPVSNLSRQSSRTPFTNLTQVDADLALARTLQEQERAYMMLRMNAEGNGYGSSDSGSFVHEDDDDDLDEMNGDDDEDDNEDSDVDEDVFDVHAREEEEEDEDDELENNETVELDPSAFSSDEAYARALQDAEDRELVGRLMSLSGVNDTIFVGDEEDSEDNDHDHDSNSQDTWEDIDPDELSYEELIALGEVVGTESRGLSSSMIASLPTVNYKMPSNQDGSTDQCVICRLDYEDGETLTVLSCKHLYHPECINNWLKINKVCPVCSSEVSTSGNR